MAGVTGIQLWDRKTQSWVSAAALSSMGVLRVALSSDSWFPPMGGGAVTLIGPMGQATGATSLPVVIASNQPPLYVTGSFAASPAVQPISGSVVVMGTVTALIAQPVAVTGGLGSVNVLGTPTVLIGNQQPISVAGGLGSVNVLGTVNVLIGGQPIAVTGAGGLGSVNVINSPAVTIVGVPTVDIRASGMSSTTISGTVLTQPFAARGLSAIGSCVISGTTETVFIAPGGTYFHDLVGLIVANSHSSQPRRVSIRGALGSAVLLTINVMPSDTVVVPFSSPLEAPARNMAWTAQLALVGGSTYISAKAIKIL